MTCNGHFEVGVGQCERIPSALAEAARLLRQLNEVDECGVGRGRANGKQEGDQTARNGIHRRNLLLHG